jgi:signal transduction histidine kinase
MSTGEPGTEFVSRGFQGYTRAEMTATSVITSREDPKWRWVLPVTRSTRDYIRSQIPALQLCYALAVALIYTAAQIGGESRTVLVTWWLVEAAATFAVRALIYGRLSRASPVEVAGNPALRSLPLVATALAAAHWCWTATIFIGPSLGPTTVVVLLTFVMLSVACLGIAPASPAICIIYLVPVWSTTAYELFNSEGVSGGTLLILGAALAAALWASYYIVVSGVRRYLVQSDEVELLVAELRDRNEEVERLRGTAEHEFGERTAFFANASHDFRQRVHAMKLLAHSSLSESASTPPAKSSTHRLAAVVEELENYMTDVLDFVRLDSTVRNPPKSATPIQTIFHELELAFEDIAASRHVDLRVVTTQLVVATDAALLLRILENLVSNSLKFARRRVLVCARQSSGELRIDVRDDGCGIDPESIPKVFEAFYQEKGGGESARDGFGLGLAIVKRLADALGYEIRVASVANRGTLFRLVIGPGDLAHA